MASDYITKGYLDTKFEEFEESITDKFDSKLTQLKSDIFDKLDKMAGSEAKSEEEEAAHSMSHERISDDLDAVNKRVSALEKN